MVTVRFRGGAREGGSLGCADPSAPLQETFGTQDMSGLRRYEVALEAEEDFATATQHYLLYSALQTATLQQATEEGHSGGTAGG
ncbi:uncharacterized protein LOC107147832 isoform X2 [Marmota marmota marmota]|uniref:uncharacterized protein LOC107147832 isoform X2 n=1 Tax=Marmota marmota marmota TaxID=9994 RepID=UPI002092655A|nr:uncharacterized protein LOC107147832 isoform X2 [Marmota marmota marmota]